MTIPILLILSAYLIWVTLRDAVHVGFEPLFRRDMCFELAHSVRQRKMTTALIEACATLGLKYGYPRGVHTHNRELTPNTHGVLVDIDLSALGKLAAILKQRSRHIDAYILIEIGQRAFYLPALKFVVNPTTTTMPKDSATPSNQQDTPSLSPASEDAATDSALPSDPLLFIDQERDTILRLLEAAIIMSRTASHKRPDSLTNYWNRYGDLMHALIADRRSHELVAVLDRLRDISVEWAEIAPDVPVGRTPRLFARAHTGFDGPLGDHVANAIRSAISTEDRTMFEAFTSFLSALAIRASTRHFPHLVHEVGALVQFMYYQSSTYMVYTDIRNREFDEIAYHLIWHLAQIDIDDEDDTKDPDASVSDRSRAHSTLEQSIWTIVSLIRVAIQVDNSNDADRFMTRLFEHESHRHFVAFDAPELESKATLFDYLKMVLAGWSASWLEGHEGNQAAKTVLRSIPAAQLSREWLIAVWELYRDPTDFGNPIDSRLGIDHWDPTEPENVWPGVGEARNVDSQWIERGLHLLLLHGRGGSAHKDFFRRPPVRHTWSEARSREWLERLASLQAMGEEDNSRQDVINDVMQIIRQRQIAAESAYILRALSMPIDDAIWSRFVESVNERFSEHQHWTHVVRSLASEHSECQQTAVRARSGIWIWRDFFVPGNNWMDGFSPALGERLAIVEAVGLFGAAEEYCTVGHPIKHLAELATHVRAAANELREAGFSPSVIVLPQPDRFACALFDRPLWELKRDQEYGRAALARWEGMLVLYWPHSDAKVTMVADCGALFGRNRTDHKEGVVVKLRDMGEDERSDRVAQIEEAIRKGELPGNDLLQVVAEAFAIPEFGLANGMAGISMSIDESDGSHAMSPYDKIYHRITCPEIEGDDGIRIRLSKKLPGEHEDRMPCTTCRPDRIDFDAIDLCAMKDI